MSYLLPVSVVAINDLIPFQGHSEKLTLVPLRKSSGDTTHDVLLECSPEQFLDVVYLFCEDVVVDFLHQRTDVLGCLRQDSLFSEVLDSFVPTSRLTVCLNDTLYLVTLGRIALAPLDLVYFLEVIADYLTLQQLAVCVRLGVVTTDMPLVIDEIDEFGVKEFCMDCGRCAKTCPGKAISSRGMEEADGVLRWKINAEECYRRWRSLGTDCAICIANCPFTYGIPQDLIESIKKSKEVRAEILKDFEEKYGIRPIIREDAEWLDRSGD